MEEVTCAVSLLQGSAYDWFKLVLRSLRLPDPIPWEFFIQELKAKYVSDMYREQLSYDMHVTSPLGHSVNVNRVYKNCPIIIHDHKFSADLIVLPFCEFDLILGMDWLSKHRAIIDCDKKTVVLRCFD